MPINTKGNTNSTIKAEIINPLPFCTLSIFSHYRHITKHYTNLSYTLNPKYYQLLSFLTGLCKPDNSFMYSTHLNNQYNEAIRYSLQHYNISDNKETIGRHISGSQTKVSGPTFRKRFKFLISQTLVVQVSKQLFVINPMLTYHSSIFNADQYAGFQNAYQIALASPDPNKTIRVVCVQYYLNIATDSRPISLNTKKAKSIRAVVSKSSIPKHTQHNNTPLYQTPHKQTIHDTEGITPTPITSTTTFQNMPSLD